METALQIQRERMGQLAHRQGHTVLDWVYDQPANPGLSSGQRMAIARDVFVARQKLAVPDEEARRVLRAQDSVFSMFAQDHPQMFSLITEREKGAAHFQVLQELAALRRQVEQGKSEAEATVKASEIIMTHTAKGPASGTEK